MKLCECGCGMPTRVPTVTNRSVGVIRGVPQRFVRGHNARMVTKRPKPAGPSQRKGSEHYRWNGGRFSTSCGYTMVRAPEHPRARKGYVPEHILTAERTFGEYLPAGAQVHHVNGDRSDNRPANLVICDSDGYHKLLHMRQRALEACGDANKRRCMYCKQWDHAECMVGIKQRKAMYHRECCREYQRSLKAARGGSRHGASSVIMNEKVASHGTV